MQVNNPAATAPVASNESNEIEVRRQESKSSLRWAALFLGELRDGLTMVRRVMFLFPYILTHKKVLYCSLFSPLTFCRISLLRN